MVNHDAALRGGKVEEIAVGDWFNLLAEKTAREITAHRRSENDGTDRRDLITIVKDGMRAALRTHAGESAAQSERAGLERAAIDEDELMRAYEIWRGPTSMPVHPVTAFKAGFSFGTRHVLSAAKEGGRGMSAST